ncbi:PEP-CTERM sorting domain-containing protein [Rhizobacter fulvus]
MNFSRNVLGALIAVSTLAASGSSFAVNAPVADGSWACGAVTFSAAASDCYGSIAPPPNDDLTQVNAIIAAEGWGAPFSIQYKDNSSAVGTTTSFIDAVGLSNSGGYVTFAQAFSSPLVLTLKLGQAWSAYYFADGVAAGNLAYTVNLANTSGLGLSHASLFTNVPAVPEPQTYALMLAGMGAIGFMARRRKPAA